MVYSKLLHNLDNIGVRGNALILFKNYLSNRQQAVKVNISKSPYAPVISGIPQGTLLEPLLFIIYINDLSETIKLKF